MLYLATVQEKMLKSMEHINSMVNLYPDRGHHDGNTASSVHTNARSPGCRTGSAVSTRYQNCSWPRPEPSTGQSPRLRSLRRRRTGSIRGDGSGVAESGEDGAPEGIKVAEERLPAGSYLTNVIKAGPVPANSAKVSSTPVTGRRGVRGAPSSPCEGGVFGFGRLTHPRPDPRCRGCLLLGQFL